MFLHFLLLAAFNKPQGQFDNSTNGTLFPDVSKNISDPFDNMTKDLPIMPDLFHISPFMLLKKMGDEDKENGTIRKNLTPTALELTSAEQAKTQQQNTTGMANKIFKYLFSDFSSTTKNSVKLFGDKGNETEAKGNKTEAKGETTTTV